MTLLFERLAEQVGTASVDVARSAVGPTSVDQVAAACKVFAAAGAASTASYTRSSSAPVDGVAGAPRWTLSLSRLRDLWVGAAVGIVGAGAGVSVAELRTALRPTGRVVPGLSVLADHLTVGTVVTGGMLPRRAITGVRVVLPSGQVLNHGGAILKDVVGYDLAGILSGAGGGLAVVVEVMLRLTPPGGGGDWPPSGPVRHGPLWRRLERALDPSGLFGGG